MNTYIKGDNITELPCDPRHRFHYECISNWIILNNRCPLDNKPVTIEAIQKYNKDK